MTLSTDNSLRQMQNLFEGNKSGGVEEYRYHSHLRSSHGQKGRLEEAIDVRSLVSL